MFSNDTNQQLVPQRSPRFRQPTVIFKEISMKASRTLVINNAKTKRQAGLTLIETLVALAIFALVVGGAIALFSGASSSQTTTQMTSDLNAIKASTKSLYFGQGGYGTTGTSLNEVLINGKKVPSTFSITGTAPSRVINHSLNGTVAVASAVSQFTVTASAIPTDVCIGLATMSGWDSVKVGTAAARVPPVSPATASTDCSAAATQSIIFTGS
jgi:prepilin-type N-terminal cleavage/methylation domain-containing protein